MNPRDIVAVVTGAGSGVGSCVARALAAKGAAVALVGRRKDRLDLVADEIMAARGRAMVAPCDVGDQKWIHVLHEEVTQKLGLVTVLFNGAGIFGQVLPISQSDPDEWIQTLRINLIGPYLMCRTFVNGMIEKGWGRIINVSSAASIMPPGGHSSAYQLSKVALNQLTRELAAELKDTGVTANVLHPGEVKTEMWAFIKSESARLGNDGMQSWAKMVEETGGDPPEKTAELVLDLIGPDSAQINGEFLWIRDGIKKPSPTW
jgi:3-oxoacyl-[acyl-carrier protein] reductase